MRDFFVKKISVLILAVVASVSASAALCTMIHRQTVASSYIFSGQSHNVFKNFVKDEVFQHMVRA